MLGVVRTVRTTSAIAALAAACAAALLWMPAPAGAVLSGKNGRIAFISGRDGGDAQSKLFFRGALSLTSPTVTGPITPPGGQYRHPTWSPDRTKIAFANGTPGPATTENFDIFVMDVQTRAISPITDLTDGLSADRPAWSPDGTRIAYEHQPVDNSALRDIRVQPANDLQPPFDALDLTTAGPSESKPAWTPDSQTIYYSSGNADFSNTTILKEPGTGGTATPGVSDTGLISEFQPSLSPDGTRICYTIGTGFNNTADVVVASVANPVLAQVVSLDAASADYNCTWSPEGDEIAFVNGAFSAGSLVSVKPDGTGFSVLSDVAGVFDGNPDWAPDGRPTCEDGAVTTPANTPVTIPLTCTDTGPAYELTPVRETTTNDGAPTQGTLTFGPIGDPSNITYTPNQGFSGTDTIKYLGFDDYGFGTDTGTITITVTPPAGGAGGGGGGAGGPAAGQPPFPAKLEVARARVDRSARRLDVLAPITARAAGRVRVSFQAAGRTERFTVPVDASNARVRIDRRIPANQARLGTGILTIAYPGDPDTQPQEVRLRAAAQGAALDPGRPTITGGRLRATGTIARRARGVVRVQLLYEPAGQNTRTLQYSGPIRNGRYRLDSALPADVSAQLTQRRGVVHSYTLFTGYAPARMRGEMASFQVQPPR